MSGALLKLEGVEKGFGAKQVLRGVDLEVARGQSLVVIGGSGSGKSVMLKKALGLMTHPTFVFVFQEKAPPYLVTVVTLEEAALLAGGLKNERAAATFAKCLRTGQIRTAAA